jgi:hypothetical protein
MHLVGYLYEDNVRRYLPIYNYTALKFVLL